MRDRRHVHGTPLRPARYQNGCRNKVAYTSKKQAAGRLRALGANDGWVITKMSVYKCDGCRFWHFGHDRRKQA